MALNHLRTDPEPAALTWARLECAASLVRNGLSVDEAAVKVLLSSAEIQSWIDRKPPTRRIEDDDPGARYDATTLKLVEAHRNGGQIEINHDQYKYYFRPRLSALSDPDAAALVAELDKRFKMP